MFATVYTASLHVVLFVLVHLFGGPNAGSRVALCLVRTRAPAAAQPGSACPAGTVHSGMGICDRYLSSVPDGRSRLSRHRPVCLRLLPGGGVGTGGRRWAVASSRTSPGAPAGSGSRATGRDRTRCPARCTAGSAGSARSVCHVHGCHRILSVI